MTFIYRAALAVITLATAAFLYATVPPAPTSRAVETSVTSSVDRSTDKTGYLSNDTPPLRFRGGNASIVAFVSVIETYCGVAPPGYVYLACVRDSKQGSVMFVPNPCAYPEGDAYAHLVCHELGHLNGWPATHGK